MMRSRERLAIAVRRPDGGIELKREPVHPIFRSHWARMPFVRGLLMLWDSLGVGISALTYSANVAAGEEILASGPAMWATVILSLVIGLGIFFALPALVAYALERFIHTSWESNFLEGLVRLGLFLLYLVLIGKVPDIQRVFAYHGAEHKAINAYEAGEPLTVERIRHYSTQHPRCGTGFLLIVVIVSVFVFGFLGRPPILLRLASRLLFLPLIAAISYELMRLAAAHPANWLARGLLKPALALQGLTTRPPSDDMLEVSLAALSAILPEVIEGDEAERQSSRTDGSPDAQIASS